MKRTLKNLFRILGYEIRRVLPAPSDPDSIAARTVKDSQYYKKWSTEIPVYTPWLGDERVSSISSRVAEHTIVSVDRCYFLYCAALHASSLSSNFAECGVYKGGTALLRSEVAEIKNTVHIFDAFLGLPEPDKSADNYYTAGTFKDTRYEDVRGLLQPYADRVQIHRGWMPDTLADVERDTFSLVHSDVDLYQTAKACCEFFYPRVCEGGIIVFDDYGFPACRGEREAVDEYFSTKVDKPICLPTGQAFVIKQKESNANSTS